MPTTPFTYQMNYVFFQSYILPSLGMSSIQFWKRFLQEKSDWRNALMFLKSKNEKLKYHSSCNDFYFMRRL